MIRMRQAFNKQAMADRTQMAQLRRQIDELMEWERNTIPQKGGVGTARPNSVVVSHAVPVPAALTTAATATHTQPPTRRSADLIDAATHRGSGRPNPPWGGKTKKR